MSVAEPCLIGNPYTKTVAARWQILAPKSRTPLHRRQRFAWDMRVIAKAHAIRTECPSLGLEKLHLFLDDWCEPRHLACP